MPLVRSSSSLSYKFRYVTSLHPVNNPIGQCLLEPDKLYVISHIERIGLGVVVYLYCSLQYRLPDHYAEVVSDDDIARVNRHKAIYILIKQSRSDQPGVFDLVID
jgi:hypothetical protein